MVSAKHGVCACYLQHANRHDVYFLSKHNEFNNRIYIFADSFFQRCSRNHSNFFSVTLSFSCPFTVIVRCEQRRTQITRWHNFRHPHSRSVLSICPRTRVLVPSTAKSLLRFGSASTTTLVRPVFLPRPSVPIQRAPQHGSRGRPRCTDKHLATHFHSCTSAYTADNILKLGFQ